MKDSWDSIPSTHLSGRKATVRHLSVSVRSLVGASTRLSRTFARQHGLHSTDFSALLQIFHSERAGRPLTSTDLARRLDLSSGAITYVVERLVSGGHVLRDTDARDRRKVVLRYASHGSDLAAGFFGPLTLRLMDELTEYTEAELTTATRVLDDVVRILRDYDTESEQTGSDDAAG